jgi:hypothetical protein
MQITRRSHLYGDSYSPGRRNRKTLPALRPPKTLKPKGLSSYVITGGQRRPLTFIERRQRSTAPGLWMGCRMLGLRLGEWAWAQVLRKLSSSVQLAFRSGCASAFALLISVAHANAIGFAVYGQSPSTVSFTWETRPETPGMAKRVIMEVRNSLPEKVTVALRINLLDGGKPRQVIPTFVAQRLPNATPVVRALKKIARVRLDAKRSAMPARQAMM